MFIFLDTNKRTSIISTNVRHDFTGALDITSLQNYYGRK